MAGFRGDIYRNLHIYYSKKYKTFYKKTQVLFYFAGSANGMSKYVKKGHRSITELSTETRSTHPFALAIINKAESIGIPLKPAEKFSIIQGKGAEGTVNGRKYWIGSHRFMHEKGTEPPEFHVKAEALEASGKSVGAIGTDDHVCGIISIEDKIRNRTASVVSALKKLGLQRVVMLTGDNIKNG